MTYLITGVTGRTGAAAANLLLKNNTPIKVLVRSEEAGKIWQDKGASVAIGDFNDPGSLSSAFKDIRGAYIMTPPLAEAENLLAARVALEENIINATIDNNVEHVVLLSAFAAHLPEGTGQIVGLHRMENRFSDSDISFTSLRAAFFMENWAPSVAGAKNTGNFPSFIHPTYLKIEQVSTSDIGKAIVRALNDPVTGQRCVSVAGPEKYSAVDAVTILNNTLSSDIKAVELDEGKWHDVWSGLGWSEDRCRLYQEFFNSINSGLAKFSEDDDIWRGSDHFEDVIRSMA